MGNSKLKTAKNANNFFASKAQRKARTGGNAIQPKGLPQIVKTPKPAPDNFSLPHTEIFYLLFHAILATVSVAREGANAKEKKPLPSAAPAEIFTPKMVSYTPPNEKDGDAATELFFGNGKFYAKTDLKDFEKVRDLPRGLAAALPSALIFIFSQSRKIGKSWKRNGGGHFDVNRADFLTFANLEKSSPPNALLELAVELIQSTGLAWEGKDYAPLYDSFSTLTTEPTKGYKAKREKAKPYAHGVRIEVSAENEIFGKVFYKTHTIQSTVTAALTAAELRGYVELKSAFSLGYKSTALRNFVAAAGFAYNPRTTARLAKQASAAIKEIANFDDDFKDAWVDLPKGRNAFENAQIRFTPKPNEVSDKPALVGGGNAELAPERAEPAAVPERVTMALVPEGHLAFIVKPEFLLTLAALINYARQATPPEPEPKKTIRARTTDALPADFVAANDEFFPQDFKTRLNAFLAPWLRFFKKVGETPKATGKTRHSLLKTFFGALWHFLKDFFTGKVLSRVYKRMRARLAEFLEKGDGNGF